MQVLVFAHVPPPHHGQSYMIKVMLDNLEKFNSDSAKKVVLFHVNAQLSDGVSDIGALRLGKFFRLAKYIFQTWWMRWKYSIDAFYYVPAPAKPSALYRDWLVLLFAASIFRLKVFHWHATGLGSWVVEKKSSGGFRRRFESWVTRKLHAQHNLSCVLNEWGRREVAVFSPPHVAVVANGIPDPCPDFNVTLLTERLQRYKQRVGKNAGEPSVFRLLFLAHATRAKGLFDAVEAVARANAQLVSKRAGWRVCLTVAGAFVDREEEMAFRQRILGEDLRLEGVMEPENRAVIYAGYASSEVKDRLLRQADALCFASYFPNEGQPVAVIEALAYGLPVVLTYWRALPEMIPANLAYLVEPNNPDALSEAFVNLIGETRFEDYRKHYLDYYTLEKHCERLHSALASLIKT